MSAQRRVALLVGAVAVAAVAVVAVAVVSSDGSSGETTTQASTTPKPREGRPPLSFALGFRTDPEARDLLKGQALYARGELAAAAALFAKHDSLEGKVGAALAGWPEGSLDRLEQLAKLYPDAAVVQLHLGLARLWANEGDPTAAWRSASRRSPTRHTPSSPATCCIPNLPRGLPAFIPSFSAPAGITKLPPARQLEALRVAARARRRSRAAAVRRRPAAGRAAASRRRASSIGRRAAIPATSRRRSPAPSGQFDKDAPERAFGRLGPLSRTYPDEPTVRFHLGVLLLWTGRIDEAQRQFRLAAKAQPGSPLAREALRYLETIRTARS